MTDVCLSRPIAIGENLRDLWSQWSQDLFDFPLVLPNFPHLQCCLIALYDEVENEEPSHCLPASTRPLSKHVLVSSLATH